MFLLFSMEWDNVWTVATNRHIVHPKMICKYRETQWNDTDRRKLKNLRKTCPNSTLSTTNPTYIDQGVNLDLAVWGRQLTVWASHHIGNKETRIV
jgi:hypothetical protein